MIGMMPVKMKVGEIFSRRKELFFEKGSPQEEPVWKLGILAVL